MLASSTVSSVILILLKDFSMEEVLIFSLRAIRMLPLFLMSKAVRFLWFFLRTKLQR